MTVKLLTERHLQFPSLRGGCTGLSESTLVKMSHCWKSHVVAHMYIENVSILLINLVFNDSLGPHNMIGI